MLLDQLSRHWWVIALRGLVAVLFGIMAFVWPALTLTVLVLLWGAYALVDGILALVYAFRSATRDRWWPILEGIVSIAAGLIALVWPGMTALALLYIIAAWAIVTGVFEIIQAIRLRELIQGEWLMVLSGLLSIVFGVLLVISPGAGALAVVWIIGAYAIVFGLLLIFLGFRVRGFAGRDRAPQPA